MLVLIELTLEGSRLGGIDGEPSVDIKVLNTAINRLDESSIAAHMMLVINTMVDDGIIDSDDAADKLKEAVAEMLNGMSPDNRTSGWWKVDNDADESYQLQIIG